MAAAPGEAAAESVVQMKFRSSANREGPTVANAATGDCGLEIARLNYICSSVFWKASTNLTLRINVLEGSAVFFSRPCDAMRARRQRAIEG